MRLTVENLSVERGGRLVLHGVALALKEGEALAVTGPNGAGKSTLLRALAGFLPNSGGHITLHGANTETSPAEHMHLLGHSDGVKSALTARENARFWADFLGGDSSSIETALDAVGLSHAADLPAGSLSAGQRKRLALARLVVAKRDIWLLDEPTSVLDTDGMSRLASLVEIHRAGGGIVIAATHADLGWPKKQRMVLGSAV